MRANRGGCDADLLLSVSRCSDQLTIDNYQLTTNLALSLFDGVGRFIFRSALGLNLRSLKLA